MSFLSVENTREKAVVFFKEPDVVDLTALAVRRDRRESMMDYYLCFKKYEDTRGSYKTFLIEF